MRETDAAVLLGAVQRAGDQLMAGLDELGQKSPEDFERWRPAVARSMEALYRELLEPIFLEHPQLVSKALGVSSSSEQE